MCDYIKPLPKGITYVGPEGYKHVEKLVDEVYHLFEEAHNRVIEVHTYNTKCNKIEDEMYEKALECYRTTLWWKRFFNLIKKPHRHMFTSSKRHCSHIDNERSSCFTTILLPLKKYMMATSNNRELFVFYDYDDYNIKLIIRLKEGIAYEE